jgi:N-acetylmuramic acid 6-phosphate etherase
MSPEDKAKAFLEKSQLFRLGHLVTERRHPETKNLSQDAKEDLGKAIQSLVKVDQLAIEKYKAYGNALEKFKADVQSALNDGAKVFLCGCGATGRLSLLIESLWREKNPMSEQVQAFMAGGDTAIVHSLEGFEDYPEYGARHLKEMGFGENDLLISCTEGGETPYVIGATEEAAKISKRKPYFLYCNPDDVLVSLVKRSRDVITNKNIEKLNLSVGPMGISGSTRMQASTVLQLSVGYALLLDFGVEDYFAELDEAFSLYSENAELFLPGFIERESKVYESGDYILYELQDHFITVFTDTTERAPTFSLTPFDGKLTSTDRDPSLCYISIPSAKTAEEAWLKLLRRKPRALNWSEIEHRTTDEYTYGFDFGEGAKAFRQKRIGDAEQISFHISCSGNNFQWQLMDHEMALDVRESFSPLLRHTILKMLLNVHSTLVMARIGRFESNVMTFVYPTNGKLVDRATRYVLAILEDRKIKASYEDVVFKLFKEFDQLKSGDSVVLKTVEAFT